MAPVLVADLARRKDIRVLMSLYSDVWHVVVAKSASITDLTDLAGKRLLIGAEVSGTKWGAEQMLLALGISAANYTRVPMDSYFEAAEKLQQGEADAAFFISATPAPAVSAALSSGCCELLDLRDVRELLKARVRGLEDRDIPSHAYENHFETVQTLGTRALLVAREDLGDAVVTGVLDAVFDHISDLAVAHIRVQDIRLEKVFTGLPDGLEFHPAALEFQERETGKVRIATGVINGRYYQLGQRIQLVLQKKGIPARVIHTDGSLENLALLSDSQKTLAITQYDTALAALWESDVYSRPGLAREIPSVKGLRRIASLHHERVHAIIRRDRIPLEMRERPTLRALENLRVCLGPSNSGTQIIARVLLSYHDTQPLGDDLFLSVPDMVARIGSGEIDAGFFMSGVPSEALETMVDDDRNRVLSIDLRSVSGLLGPALQTFRIAPASYGSQREDETPIETLATRAVLVGSEDLPFDVARKITEALFEGEAFLALEGGREAMAASLKSLPLHPGAQAYYEREGLIPRDWWKPSWGEVLNNSWRVLAIVVILIAGVQGILKLRRDRTSNEIGRRILAVPLGSTEPDSVGRLLRIRREEIRERAISRWWRLGELDKSRWRHLYDLINLRIVGAQANLARSLSKEFRKIAEETGPEDASRIERIRSFEERTCRYFEKGELDGAQHGLLLDVIREAYRRISETSSD